MEHHSTLSPSAIPALLKCGCYKGKKEAGEHADRGRIQHEHLEQLLNGIDVTAGTTIEEMRQVIWAVDEIKDLAAGRELHVEEKLVVLDNDFSEVTFGTADVVIGNGEAIVDYKSGQERDYAGQMAAYALGAMQRYCTHELDVVILYGRNQKVERYTTTEAACIAYIAEARKNIAAGIATPCDYCGWCDNQPTCPAIVERVNAVTVARTDWQLEQYHTSSISDPAQMSKALDIADAIEGWCDNVRNFARKMIECGQNVPGWKLKPRAGKRSVTDILKAYELAGLAPDKFISACTLAIGKLEVEFALAHPEIKKAEAKRQLESKLSAVMEQGQDSFTLAKEKTA